MQDKEKLIAQAISKYMQCELLQIFLLGSGANGEVYRCKIDKQPFDIAVKVTNYSDMLTKEVDTINFINSKVDIKLPKIYFCHLSDNDIDANIVGMSYIDGVSADKINWLFKGKQRKAFATAAIDNFMQLQNIKNDTYGVVGGEQFENWLDYYKPFAKARLDYIIPLAREQKFPKAVVNALQKAYDNLDEILSEVGEPTLIHGDYWAPNLLVNKESMEFVGCVDPFNLTWAESEYEIFTMILFPQLKLYDEYKSRMKTSKYFDLKARMYSLFSEVYWFELLGKGNFGFMKWVAKKLNKLMKKFNLGE